MRGELAGGACGESLRGENTGGEYTVGKSTEGEYTGGENTVREYTQTTISYVLIYLIIRSCNEQELKTWDREDLKRKPWIWRN